MLAKGQRRGFPTGPAVDSNIIWQWAFVLDCLICHRAAQKKKTLIMTTTRRAIFLLCLTASILLLTSCSSLRVRNLRLWMPPSFSGMERKNAELILEAPSSVMDLKNAEKLNDDSKKLLSAAWDDIQSKPEIWICRTEQCYQRLGGGSPIAKSLGSRIIISPRGQSAGILAHERWHSEFVHRVGLITAYKVPRWFDEGVAVWISQEPRHSEEMYQRILNQKIVPPKLETLIGFKDWDIAIGLYGDHLKTTDVDSLNVVYPTAGHEVRRWIAIVGVNGLRQLIDKLADGAEFSPTYLELERAAKK